MLVFFKENYDCVIKDKATIRLGDTLCDLLNTNIESLQALEKRAIDLLSEGNEETYTTQMKLIITEMQKLPYNKYSNDFDVLSGSQAHNKKPLEKITSFISTTYKCSIFFRTIVDKCLLYDLNAKPIKRLMQYGLNKFNMEADKAIKYSGTAEAPSLSLFYEIVEDKLLQCFSFVTLPQFAYHEFMKMISLNLTIQKCKNCKDYFVIFGERIIEYCSNIPKGQSRPCSVIGPATLYGQKVKNDPILKIYTRAYKKYVARKRSGIISADEFKEWTVKARALRDKAYAEKTPPEVFAEWLQ